MRTPRRRSTLTRTGLVVTAAALCSTLGCFRRPAVSSSDASAASAVSAASATPGVTRIPRDAARFEIDVVDDSTARFKPREASWVRAGQVAYVVDPMQRDALVARLRVQSVWSGTAVALVTSQVTRVSASHVILMLPPPVPWWRTRRFWLGAMFGAIVGGSTGAVIAAQ